MYHKPPIYVNPKKCIMPLEEVDKFLNWRETLQSLRMTWPYNNYITIHIAHYRATRAELYT